MPSVRDLSLPAGRGNKRPLSPNRVYLRRLTLLTDGFTADTSPCAGWSGSTAQGQYVGLMRRSAMALDADHLRSG